MPSELTEAMIVNGVVLATVLATDLGPARKVGPDHGSVAAKAHDRRDLRIGHRRRRMSGTRSRAYPASGRTQMSRSYMSSICLAITS
jgi:hypothetical protein